MFVKNSSNVFINHLIELFHLENRSISNQTEQWETFPGNSRCEWKKIRQKNIALEHKLKRLNQKQIASSLDFQSVRKVFYIWFTFHLNLDLC